MRPVRVIQLAQTVRAVLGRNTDRNQRLVLKEDVPRVHLRIRDEEAAFMGSGFDVDVVERRHLEGSSKKNVVFEVRNFQSLVL